MTLTARAREFHDPFTSRLRRAHAFHTTLAFRERLFDTRALRVRMGLAVRLRLLVSEGRGAV